MIGMMIISKVRQLEKWRVIEDFPIYSVSSSGGVKNNKTGRILKQGIDAMGYPVAGLRKEGKRKTKLIHSLVLESFVSKRPEGKECNHKDGVKDNNYYRNLEWVTRSENMIHAYANDLKVTPKGENHPNVKLKDDEAWLIRRLLDGGVAQRLIANMFKCSQTSIYEIKNNKKRWRR